MIGYWMFGPEDPIELVRLAEDLGYDSVWTAEGYGSDCVSTLCWIGARTSRIKLGTGIMQIAARTPACVAMTAMTIDHLSGGRLILGLGVSGPQVVEGWYGQPFTKPLTRMREYVELVRKILRREGPVTFDGEHYKLPYPGGTGLGKPLKLITEPLRKEIPIYIGAEGPKSVRMATEIADGWLPLFISPYRTELYADVVERLRPGFEVACPVTAVIDRDVEQAMIPVKYMLAFYLGGMGARTKNFHADLVRRMGFGEAVDRIQELFFAGKRDEAAAAVPDQLADEVALVGPPERIKERLAAWKDSFVTTLLVGTRDPQVLRTLAEAI
ncbi:MAG: LLM class F420-dependent oxidoreductase [Candidatus Dadabacteria bacterium]|nr:MAG: LLM class F420-dependent oxidoreductase [Candidatus Dadabacteria bacterium]